MSDIVMLEGHESRAVLQTVAENQEPAIMSYLSKDKWHVAKVLIKDVVGERLLVEGCHSVKKPHPINIRIDQPVGVNFKHSYGKFVFDTTVIGLEPSTDPSSGGTIVLAVPHRIGVVQRRSYFRVSVPDSLRVSVVLWHRMVNRGSKKGAGHKYYEGRLTDISAGGAQLIIPLNTASEASGALVATEADFHKGQFIGMRFTPMPYETPLMFNAQIRNVLPTADHQALCLGLQIVGLEASDEGRQTLSRLAAVVDHYYQINQAEGKQQDSDSMPAVGTAASHIPTGASH